MGVLFSPRARFAMGSLSSVPQCKSAVVDRLFPKREGYKEYMKKEKVFSTTHFLTNLGT